MEFIDLGWHHAEHKKEAISTTKSIKSMQFQATVIHLPTEVASGPWKMINGVALAAADGVVQWSEAADRGRRSGTSSEEVRSLSSELIRTEGDPLTSEFLRQTEVARISALYARSSGFRDF